MFAKHPNPGYGPETETEVVWPHLNFICLANDSAGHSERIKEEWTENIKECTGMDFGNTNTVDSRYLDFDYLE